MIEYVENLDQNPNAKFYLFIDEIQFCYSVPNEQNPGYEITVYDMLNELKDYKNLDIYITGSNSKMLSKDIATVFRGRSSQINIYPFSFSEFNQAMGCDKRDNFDKYIIYGGMPYLLNLKTDEQRKNYLISHFEEVT